MENDIKNMTFSSIQAQRLKILKDNKALDHIVIKGNNKVLLSCPHSVPQVRLGKAKFKEIGSLYVALMLQKLTDSFLIVKTKNNGDDANFDQVSDYKDEIDKLIKENNIKYVLDFHGLAVFRPIDINLGINFGKNIETNEPAFDCLVKKLNECGFVTSIDQPFSGGPDTIAGSTKTKHTNCFTIQIEINSGLTNYPQNFNRMKELATILENWIKELK